MRRGSSEFIVEGDGLDRACSDIESIARRFEQGATKFHVGMNHTFELPMYQLLRPRCGMRTFWCAHGLYRAMKAQSYKGVASKWFYEQYQRWQAACTSHGFCGQVMLSVNGISVEEATHSATRLLPTPTFSILAFVIQAVRWSRSTAQKGGFRDDDARRSVALLLATMLKACHRDGEDFVVQLGAVDEWQCRWPRPHVRTMPFELHVSPAGMVDVADWREAATSDELPRGHCVRSWWQLLNADVSSDMQLPLVTLLRRAGSKVAGNSLFRQVVWAIAIRLQEQVLAADPCAGILEAWLRGPDVFRDTSRAQDYQLARCIEAGKLGLGVPLFLSVATDKANVKGFSFMNTVAATPGNRAVIFPPQVLAHPTCDACALVLYARDGVR
jgi:hypothetical protein